MTQNCFFWPWNPKIFCTKPIKGKVFFDLKNSKCQNCYHAIWKKSSFALADVCYSLHFSLKYVVTTISGMRPSGRVTTPQNGATWRPRSPCAFLWAYQAWPIVAPMSEAFLAILTDRCLSDGIRPRLSSLFSDLMHTSTPSVESLGCTPTKKWPWLERHSDGAIPTCHFGTKTQFSLSLVTYVSKELRTQMEPRAWVVLPNYLGTADT